MVDKEFKLRLGIPKKFPKTYESELRRHPHLPRTDFYAQRHRQTGYYCHSSDGLDNCDCMSAHSLSQDTCTFFGRPIEPLAFYLPAFTDVNQQKQCPFYGILPKEIRDLVFEYALSDDGAPMPNSENKLRREAGVASDVARIDIACALLQTCKAVYLEAYRLPLLLNGYVSYQKDGLSRPDLRRLVPWQYALIQRVDYSVQQCELEGNGLQSELNKWHAALRHSCVYVAPQLYGYNRPWKRPEGVIPSHYFGLTTFGEDIDGWCPEDGDKVTITNAFQLRDYDPENGYFYLPSKDNFIARAMVARPLTHLTIRLSRTDWWTWTDKPDSSVGEEKLALDPACGLKERPLLADMISLAEQRRAGHHPVYDGSWGTAIGNLPDLKTFELVLETFLEKKTQLEVVVDCAKTWKFPLKDLQYELVCDGKVEDLKWTNAASKESRETTVDTGSATMDIGDSGQPSDGRSENYGADEQASNVGEYAQDTEDSVAAWNVTLLDEEMTGTGTNTLPSHPSSSQVSRVDTIVGGTGQSSIAHQANDDLAPDFPPFSPLHQYPSPMESGYTGNPLSYPNSPTSPLHNPVDSPVRSEMSPGPASPQYSPPFSPLYNPPSSVGHAWYELSTEFEVRIVRFRRSRIG